MKLKNELQRLFKNVDMTKEVKNLTLLSELAVEKPGF
jgi:hypothetical protein